MGKKLTMRTLLALAAIATIASAAPVDWHTFVQPVGDLFHRCYHSEANNKCYQACSDDDLFRGFKVKGLTSEGRCDEKYDSLDSHSVEDVCDDGVTSIKYCLANKKRIIKVELETRGEKPRFVKAAASCGIATGLKCAAVVEPCIAKCKTGVEACIQCLGGDYKTCCPCLQKLDKNLKCSNSTQLGDDPFATCYHNESDNKCYEACSDDDFFHGFKVKGLTSHGACPSKYNSVDAHSVEDVCDDGVTSIKYCEADHKHIIKVRFETKGEK